MRGAEGVREKGARACLLGGKKRPGAARVRSGGSRAEGPSAVPGRFRRRVSLLPALKPSGISASASPISAPASAISAPLR